MAPDARAPWRDGDAEELRRLRERWRDLVRRVLPASAAAHPRWPIRLDHCFARVVLDEVYGRPWRDAIAAPAWRSMDADALTKAIALAEAIAADAVDLDALNASSIAARRAARRSQR